MNKRQLTHFEERVIRLVHHDFDGLSIADVADKCKVKERVIHQTLKRIKRIASQLFPILTPQHRAILYMYDQCASRKSIAEALNISEKKLSREITFLREHGFLWPRKMNQYDPSVDGDVKERF